MDFNPERIASSPFVPGALGALVTALKFTPGASWLERGINVVAGSLVAGYCAPFLLDYFKVTAPSALGGVSFLLGLLSMSIVAAVLSAVQQTKWAEIVTGWLARNKGAS